MKIAIILLAVLMPALAIQTDKMTSKLQDMLKKGFADIMVLMNDSGGRRKVILDNHRKARFFSHANRATSVSNSLQKQSNDSQIEVTNYLSSRKHKHFEKFWINNCIYIKNASTEMVHNLTEFPSVKKVHESYRITLAPVTPEITSQGSGIGAEWGVEAIEAPACWNNAGNNGVGAIVGGIDTGVLATHQDLSGNYIGDNYGWFDATDSNCQTACDGNGHGTHTMGTIVGANGIGVAPGAKWMACRALDNSGSGTLDSLYKCGQFMACPTLPDGTSPDCSKAPHVVSNSWGAFGGGDFYDSIIDAWLAAGIIPVFAAGNSGPGCGTCMSPADSMVGVIGVGATDIQNAIASFSSRGPTENGKQTPDISAPGRSIRSAWCTGDSSYNTISGTSMATPHVAGVVALLKATNPTMQFDRVKSALLNGASQNVSSGASNCGTIAESTFPNMAFGYGILNAKNTLSV